MTDTASDALAKIRSAALLDGTYKAVFMQGASGWATYSNGALLIGAFKNLFSLVGVTLPTDVVITLDGAQALLAGGAIANDIANGAKLGQCVGDAASAVSAVTGLLSVLGVGGEAVSQIADFASLISNVSLAISSGGLNILADIGAVMSLISSVKDVGSDFFGDSDQAKQVASQALLKAMTDFVTPQANYAASQAVLYNSGQLDIFDFIANIALNSPAEFKGFFPSLACYFPQWMTVGFSATGYSSGVFSSQSDTERSQIVELCTNKQQVESILINLFLIEPMQMYAQELTVSPVISMKALSLISLLLSSGTSGPVEMNFSFDILGFCLQLGVTPSMLGDDWVFKGFQRQETDLSNWQNTLPYEPLTLPYSSKPNASGLVINGKPVLTADEQQAETDYQNLVSFQLYLQSLDEAGDIQALLGIPEAVAILQRWANIQIDPVFDQTTGEITNMALNPGGVSITTQSWYETDVTSGKNPGSNPLCYPYIQANYGIDISDYWKCLNVIKVMKTAKLFADEENLLQSYDSIDIITADFQVFYQTVMAKNLNRVAQANVAQSLGIPVTALTSRKMSDGTLIFYRKVTEGNI